MKKVISFVMAVCLMFSVAVIASATSGNENIFYYGETEITVEGNDLTYEEMKEIADFVAGVDNSEHVAPVGLLCSIFGHKLSESSAVEVTHNVYATAPRCVEKLYSVNTCSRCDYIEKTLLSTARVYCH